MIDLVEYLTVHCEEDNTNVCTKIVFLMLKYGLKFPSFLCLVLIFNRNNMLDSEGMTRIQNNIFVKMNDMVKKI